MAKGVGDTDLECLQKLQLYAVLMERHLIRALPKDGPHTDEFQRVANLFGNRFLDYLGRLKRPYRINDIEKTLKALLKSTESERLYLPPPTGTDELDNHPSGLFNGKSY